LLSYGTRENGEVGYGPTETDFLYAFATAKRPRRIIQIGAGILHRNPPPRRRDATIPWKSPALILPNLDDSPRAFGGRERIKKIGFGWPVATSPFSRVP